MVRIRPKIQVEMILYAVGQSHSRTKIMARDVSTVVDEPEIRGGSNLGPSPTETLMASPIGCTNVISNKIASKMGVTFGEMKIDFSAQFDRRGTMLEHEAEHPFTDIVMDIQVKTDATPKQLDIIQSELMKYCPIAKVIRGSGATITENWIAAPL